MQFHRPRKKPSSAEIEAVLIRKYGVQTTLDLFDPRLRAIPIRQEVEYRAFERCEMCGGKKVSATLTVGYLKGKRVCSKCYHDYNAANVFK